MAAETIKEFLVGLGFKVDQAGLSKFSAGIAGAAAKAAALGAAVTAAAGVIAMGIKKIAEEGELEARLAERFRTTAAAVDGFIDSATILGVKSDDAIESLRSLDRAVVDTSMGMGRAQKVFEELGIEVKDAAGNLRPTTEVMGELAGKMKELDRGTQLRIMERLGLDQKLLYVFNADLEKLGKEIAEIDKGAGFSFDKWIAESKTFMVAWREMSREAEKWKMLFGKWLKGMAVELMPVFRAQLGRMTAGMLELRGKAMEHLPRIAQAFLPILRGIFKIAEAFIKIGMRIGQAAIGIVSFLARINDATDGWLLKIAAVVAAWKYLNLAFLASPIGIILSLAAAIALLVDDFLTWKEGGESLIDWSGDFGDAIQAAIDFVVALGDAIVQGIGVAREWLAGFFEWCAGAWQQMSDDAAATGAAIAGFGAAIAAGVDNVRAYIGSIVDAVTGGFARLRGLSVGEALRALGAGIMAALAWLAKTAAAGAQNIARAIGGALSAALQSIELGDFAKRLAAAVANVPAVWARWFGVGAQTLSRIARGIVAAFSGCAQMVAGAFHFAAQAAGKAAAHMQAALNVARGAFYAVADAIIGAAGRAATKTAAIMRAASATVTSAWQTARGVFAGIAATIAGALGAALAAIQSAAESAAAIAQAAWQTAQQALGAIMAAIAAAMGVAGAAIMAAWQGVQSALQAIAQAIGAAFQSLAELVQKAAQLIGAAGQAMVSAWQSVRAWFAGFFDFIAGGFARIVDAAGKIGGLIGGALGKVRGMFSGASLAPSAGTVAARGGGQNVQQSTTINVNGAGNPGAVAARVAGQQRSVNAEMTRNMRGATR